MRISTRQYRPLRWVQAVDQKCRSILKDLIDGRLPHTPLGCKGFDPIRIYARNIGYSTLNFEPSTFELRGIMCAIKAVEAVRADDSATISDEDTHLAQAAQWPTNR